MFGDLEFMYNTYYYTIDDKLYWLFLPYSLSLLLYTSPIWSVFVVPTVISMIMVPWTMITGITVGIIAGIEAETNFSEFQIFKNPSDGAKNSLSLSSYGETGDMERFLGEQCRIRYSCGEYDKYDEAQNRCVDCRSISLTRPEQSSTDGSNPAEHAIDGQFGTISATKGDEIKYWNALFETGENIVKEVKITLAEEIDGNIGGAKIFIGLDSSKGDLCGTLPEDAKPGKTYTIECIKNIKGTIIVIAGEKNQQFYLSEVVVISSRNSEPDYARTGCRTVCHKLLEKLNAEEECVSIFDGQEDQLQKTTILEIFEKSPDWTKYSNEEADSK